MTFKKHNRKAKAKAKDVSKLMREEKRLVVKSKQAVCRVCCNISDLLALTGMSKKQIHQ